MADSKGWVLVGVAALVLLPFMGFFLWPFFFALLFLLPFLVLAGAIFGVAYLAHGARQERDQLAGRPPRKGPDPVTELQGLNNRLAEELAEGRFQLEKARESLQKGLGG